VATTTASASEVRAGREADAGTVDATRRRSRNDLGTGVDRVASQAVA
jgi:hypothetical protein